MNRRTFLEWATHGLGVVFGAIIGVPAVAYLIDARNRPAPEGDFEPVAKLSELTVGVPKQAVLRDIRTDAWTLHPHDVIGRVWLVRQPEDKVEVFTTICPHLGCSINFESAQQHFVCPCHNGTFKLDGDRVEKPGFTNPAPRGMDKLKIELVTDPENPADKLILVKYQNFKQGEHDQVVKA
jgi:Rieske Fe-S protein